MGGNLERCFYAIQQRRGRQILSLKQKNVDTGMGAERMAMVMQGKTMFMKLICFNLWLSNKIPASRRQAGKSQNLSADRQDLKTVEEKSIRIIADHIKASVFIIGDEVGAVQCRQRLCFKKAFKKGGQARKLLGSKKTFLAGIA